LTDTLPSFREGDLRIIRPLVHTRERDLAKFAAQAKLPVIPENCPACFEAPKERHRLKQLLAAQENLHKNVFKSIRLSIKVCLILHTTFESALSGIDSSLQPLAAIGSTGCEAGTGGTHWVNATNDAEEDESSILDY
jgi:tRNA(Ile)-lysidine synthase TilS/MesJ